MLAESYLEFMSRWHLYRRWKRRRRRDETYGTYRYWQAVRDTDGLVIDLGANVGDTVWAARQFHREVHAFEPDPTALGTLYERFGHSHAVHIHPVAVGATARTTTFYRHPEPENNAKHTESTSLFYRPNKHEGGSSFEVQVIDIVAFLRSLDRPIGIVKMDIEGAEIECLNAMLDDGLTDYIGMILVETHERFSPEIAAGVEEIRRRVIADDIENVFLDWN